LKNARYFLDLICKKRYYNIVEKQGEKRVVVFTRNFLKRRIKTDPFLAVKRKRAGKNKKDGYI